MTKQQLDEVLKDIDPMDYNPVVLATANELVSGTTVICRNGYPAKMLEQLESLGFNLHVDHIISENYYLIKDADHA